MNCSSTPIERLSRRLAARGSRLHDFRERDKPRRGQSHGTRDVSKVTAIWWHQMAALISDPERCLGIPAHISIVRGGDVVLAHDVLEYLWHGHTANSFTVGVEIAARAAGIEGNPLTFWRSTREKLAGKTHADLAAEATDEQIASAIDVGEYIIDEITGRGGRIVAQGFHRNSHRSRVSDPGSRIALQVVRPLADSYGHEYGGPVVGSGSKTPTAWGGPDGVRYGWRVRGY